MPSVWEPEHPVDAALAARLVVAQFPEVARCAPERLGAGWDNDMWRFGEIAFRFPRRSLGVELIQIESRVMPWLAPRLPLPAPIPRYFGAPSPEFPYPFLGYPLLSGTTGDRLSLSAAERIALAPTLGAWLKHLHSTPIEDAAEAGVPPDTFRANMPRDAALILERLPKIPELSPADREIALTLAQSPPPNAPAGQRALLHGDLYTRHLLFDEDRAICGVIDWGDVCLGDPARDLAVAYTLLPPAARPDFWSVYGLPGGETLRRARLVALKYAVTLVVYGRDVSDEPLAREGARALSHALAE